MTKWKTELPDNVELTCENCGQELAAGVELEGLCLECWEIEQEELNDD